MTSSAISLQAFNSFSLSAFATDVVIVENATELLSEWQRARQRGLPTLILGEGSNILFLGDFHGIVLINRLKGIEADETESEWMLHVGAGENWHQLVEYTLAHQIAGLENLALIPGCVGSAPIQNIGAYGVDLKRVCTYVDVLNLNTGKVTRLNAQECRFGYRDSIFKHEYQNGFAIIAVGLCLSKNWKPILEYGELTRLDPMTVTSRDVFDAVCQMRRSKLPDPVVMGNAGSFFKNPVVPSAIAECILKHYPNAPHYPQPAGDVKIAAGWLIDQCGLKGYQIGQAAVHDKQALVLVNKGGANSDELIALARYVRNQVAAKFDVWLEPEVRFIAAEGEVDAVEVLS
ncbi:UDP-N-acetylenolpyruvoylglucosamine reductase [Dickeya parazeae Ech586]|uniref:UDP-N-acetylenolpyruvoylglucosamine reductase n=1 Tax=Dickeya zeae (strain Ech586) TaxID=590409 RepID=D2C1E1_DICZ5|nr:UDP-N-acetylmuramate dehydrogenase [Dickeya parazeae]ACZ75102.1 UDP-N-acetylenolpyruvoylglucosamine reductase [Dickeya parazeae Ech586]